VPRIPRNNAHLMEIFSSIQGEGILIGHRQIFVRFAYCNLNCRYCDTLFQPMDSCRIEDSPGSGSFRSIPNPVSLETLDNILADWQRRAPWMHHSISLTGGEPLVQADALASWLPRLSDILPVHLETNGTLPDPLESLLPHLTWISMDIKLASVTGAPTPWQEHCNFLDLARRIHVQVKVVVAEETPVKEIETVARMVSETDPDIPLIIQPITRKGEAGIRPELLLEFQSVAARSHSTVRIIPQTHTFLNLL